MVGGLEGIKSFINAGCTRNVKASAKDTRDAEHQLPCFTDVISDHNCAKHVIAQYCTTGFNWSMVLIML